MKQEDIHISFDLETLSLESNAAIVQIGAVQVGSPVRSSTHISIHDQLNIWVDM